MTQQRSERLARMEARAASDQARAFEAMSDAELEAIVLAHRPAWAERFTTRGDPHGWPELRTWEPDLREEVYQTYAEWQSGAWGVL